MSTTPITTVEQVMDLELAKYCGECGEPLDPPGSSCPECQALPDETREEARERLAADPGAIARAEAARLRVLGAQYLIAVEQTLRAADDVEYRAELRKQRDSARDRLEEAAGAHERALGALDDAVKAEKATAGPLADAVKVHERAQRAEESARRTRKGPEAEMEATVRLSAAQQVLARYQAEANAAARVREAAERAVLVAEQAVRGCEQERDTAQLVLDRHATVPLSPETAVVLLSPLLRFALGRDIDGRVLDATERAMIGMFGDALRGAGFAEYADALAASEEARIRKQLEQEFLNRPHLRQVGDGLLSAGWVNPPKPSGASSGGITTAAPNLTPVGPFGRPAGGVIPGLG